MKLPAPGLMLHPRSAKRQRYDRRTLRLHQQLLMRGTAQQCAQELASCGGRASATRAFAGGDTRLCSMALYSSIPEFRVDNHFSAGSSGCQKRISKTILKLSSLPRLAAAEWLTHWDREADILARGLTLFPSLTT